MNEGKGPDWADVHGLIEDDALEHNLSAEEVAIVWQIGLAEWERAQEEGRKASAEPGSGR